MKHIAKTTLAAAFGSLLAVGVAHAESDNYTQIQRGRYLATVGDCAACHTAPGGMPFAGGHALETPFGTIMGPNLTPDMETGIGRWSADDFARALHQGEQPDRTNLYPAFPYTFYTRVTREDADAIYAFLRSLAPVRNAVDRDALPFPFNIRFSLNGWNLLYFTPQRFQPDPQRSAEYNRGAYLVEGLGHCGSCHTSKNMLGADSSALLQGGILQAWLAPNITSDRRIGVGGWSVDEIVEYLQTGRNVHSAATGPMAEVVAQSTSQMTTDDLRAMAVYLRERPTTASPAPAVLSADNPQMRAGAAIYTDTCMACHAGNGTGVGRLFPGLAGSASVQQNDPTSVIRVVLEGARAVATDHAMTSPAMPSLGWRLSDEQVASVLTYIRNSWGNAAAPVTAGMVGKMRSTLAERN